MRSGSICVLLVVLAILTTADAQTIFYPTQAAFNASPGPPGFTGGPVSLNLDFTSATSVNPTPPCNPPTVITTGGYSFQGGHADPCLEIIDGQNIGDPGDFLLTEYSGAGSNLDTNLIITLLPNTTALTFALKDVNQGLPTGVQDSYQITLSDGSSTVVTPASFGSYAFVGFKSTNVITTVTIERLTASPNGAPAVEDFASNGLQPATTPEPSAAALLSTALALAFMFRSRRPLPPLRQ